MRIPETRSIGAIGKSKKKSTASSATGIFSLDAPTGNTPAAQRAAVGSAMPVADISSLLAVQDTSYEPHKSSAINHGFDTLDALDSLKLDVLSGHVSRQKLLLLAELVEKQRSNLSDPSLTNVLDHIELRARVELAKFEQNRR